VMPVGVIVSDRNGAILMNNPAAETILGGYVTGNIHQPKRAYSTHRLDGSPFPADEMPLVQAMRDGRIIEDVEILIRLPDGEERVILTGAAPVQDDAGNIISGVTVFQDITEQMLLVQRSQEIAADLEQERNLLQTIMEHTPSQLAYFDPDFNFVRVNPAYVQNLDYDEDDLIGHNHFGFFPNDENQAIFERVRDTGEPAKFIAKAFTFLGRSDLGTTYWDWTLVPVQNGRGEPQGLVLSLADVTEREHNREMLQRYADRLQVLHEIDQAILGARSIEEIGASVLNRVPQLLGCIWASIVLYNLERNTMRTLAIHPHGETQSGEDQYSAIDPLYAKALTGLTQGQSCIVEDMSLAPPNSPLLKRLQAGGVQALAMVPLIIGGRLAGSLNFGMRMPGALMPDHLEIAQELANQLAIGIHQIYLNEHLRQHTEELEILVAQRTQLLQDREARLQAIVDNAALGIVITDLEGTILETNQAFQSMLQYSDAELRGVHLAKFAHPQDVAAYVTLYDDLLAEKRTTAALEKRYIRKDGRGVQARSSFSLIHGTGHKPQIGIVLVEDITEQKKAQQALIQAEKLTATGRLAVSLAHEINNPMQSVIGCLGLALESLDEGDEADVRELLEIAIEELDRAARTVSDLRDMNRSSESEEQELIDVNKLLEHILVLVRKQCDRFEIDTEWNPAGDLPVLMAVPARIRQVFLNLALNAIDAMPDGGRLQISTGCVAEPARVWVAFTDTGHGIAPETLPHIFDPFYTTKPDGLGMGLYITYNIVEEHGGAIEVQSALNERTTFTVWLPAPDRTEDGGS